METIALAIHLLLTLALIGVVLMQRSEGGALGMGGGGSGAGLFSARGTANALTRATAILGALFIASSLFLAILAGQDSDGTSIFDRPEAQQATTTIAPEDGAPTVPLAE